MTQLDSETKEQIIEKVANLLTSTGTYIHLQYSHFLVKWLKKQFRHVDYTYNRKDFPFACIMTAKQN